MHKLIPDADVVTVILEIERLTKGGTPHAPGSPEAKTIDLALHRLAQDAETAGIAALGRKAIATVVRELEDQPLRAAYTNPAGSGTPKRKSSKAG